MNVIEIVSIVLGSGAFTAVVKFALDKLNDRKLHKGKKIDKIEEILNKVGDLDKKVDTIESRVEKIEIDSCRTQIMMLIHDFPDKEAEIMKAAEHYFVDLNGDQYITRLFADWLDSENIADPEWFNRNK